MKISNLIWEVVELPTNDTAINGDYGKCVYVNQKIYIDKTLIPQHKRRVLIHEIAHAFVFSYLLENKTQYSEEEVVEFVAAFGEQIIGLADEYFKHR